MAVVTLSLALSLARAQGVACSVHRVARLMKRHGISAQVKPRFVVTTDSNHERPVAPNHLAQEFSASAADTRWACDLTYIWTKEGWLYLAVVLVLYSRRIVGWSLKNRMETELVRATLTAALLAREPQAGLLCHSDRGSQYASAEYQEQLGAAGALCSVSRKGNCYDNAAVESFFASLKKELIHRTTFVTQPQARTKIFECIESWYNRRRRHSAIGYLSPQAFERQENEQKQALTHFKRVAA